MKSLAPFSLLVGYLVAANAQAQTPPSPAEAPPSAESPASPSAEASKPSAEPAANPTEEAPRAEEGAAVGASPKVDIGPAAAEVPPAPGGSTEDDARRQSLGMGNSLTSSTGLLRASEAGSGAPGTFRVSLLGSYFAKSSFLCNGTPSGGCDYRTPGDFRKDEARALRA